jgi:hypothetical protein
VSRIAPPPPERQEIALRGIVGALRPDGRPLAPLQSETLHAVTSELWGSPLDCDRVEPIGPAELAEAFPDEPPGARRRLVQLMVTLELLLSPLPPDVADRVGHYADELGVEEPMLRASRLLAEDQLTLMYMCIQRNSWYPAETRREVVRGQGLELVRSKLAYYGLAADPELAAKWRALGGLPDGSWGRGVYDFYLRNGFPFPGERHGIYEVGAMHDWVHVITDYGTTPEGEIDVFAFIAAAMDDPAGFTLLVVTLGIFQNGSIRHMYGRPVPRAGTGALEAEGAGLRFGEAFRRGATCTQDLLGGVDHFALAAEPLDALRERFAVQPRQAPLRTQAGPAPGF